MLGNGKQSHQEERSFQISQVFRIFFTSHRNVWDSCMLQMLKMSSHPPILMKGCLEVRVKSDPAPDRDCGQDEIEIRPVLCFSLGSTAFQSLPIPFHSLEIAVKKQHTDHHMLGLRVCGVPLIFASAYPEDGGQDDLSIYKNRGFISFHFTFFSIPSYKYRKTPQS